MSPSSSLHQKFQTKFTISMVPEQLYEGHELPRHEAQDDMRQPDTKVDTRPEMRINRLVDRTLTSCCCFGIDSIKELSQLSVDANHRPHIKSPQEFRLWKIIHKAAKNSRFFNERQPVTRIDNPQQCLLWDERRKHGSLIFFTFSKRLSA